MGLETALKIMMVLGTGTALRKAAAIVTEADMEAGKTLGAEKITGTGEVVPMPVGDMGISAKKKGKKHLCGGSQSE